VTTNRFVGGHKAKKRGDFFEEYIKKILTYHGWTVTRVPNGALWRKVKGKLTLVPTKSPFDFIAINKTNVFFFDAKCRSGMKKPIPSIFKNKSTENQILNMLRIKGVKNPYTKVGFIIYLTDINRIVYVDPESIISNSKDIKYMDLGSPETANFQAILS